MPEKVVHFQIRMPPELYDRLTNWARGEEQSLNSLIGTVIEIDLLRREKLQWPATASGNGLALPPPTDDGPPS